MGFCLVVGLCPLRVGVRHSSSSSSMHATPNSSTVSQSPATRPVSFSTNSTSLIVYPVATYSSGVVPGHLPFDPGAITSSAASSAGTSSTLTWTAAGTVSFPFFFGALYDLLKNPSANFFATSAFFAPFTFPHLCQLFGWPSLPSSFPQQ